MSGKRIIVFAMLAILVVMAGVAMHEALEGPDATPFPLDADFILVVFGVQLTICFGLVLVTLQCALLAILAIFAGTLLFSASASSYWSLVADENLLFSPPRRFLTLRI